MFAGGCDLAAAEAVLVGRRSRPCSTWPTCWASWSTSRSSSLDDSGDAATCATRLLETIRQYAQERLEASGETATVRRRHAEYYVAVAEAAGPHLRSREQADWAPQVARDTDNFRVALDWAVETESSAHALRLVAPLAVTGLPIGDAAADWAATASTIPGGSLDPLLPAVAGWGARGAAQRREFTRAEELIVVAANAEAATNTRTPYVAKARTTLAMRRGEYHQGQHYGEEWVERAASSGDDFELADALIGLGSARGMNNDVSGAVATLDQAVGVARRVGAATVLWRSHVMLAFVLPIEESDRALALIDDAIEFGLRIGDRSTVATATLTKCGIAARRGEWRATFDAAVDAAEQWVRIGDPQAMAGAMGAAAIALCELGHLEPGALLLGKADSISNRRWLSWAVAMTEAADAVLMDGLGAERAATLAARGAALSDADAVAYLRQEADQLLLDE